MGMNFNSKLSLRVVLLTAMVIAGTLAGCDQTGLPTTSSGFSGKAVRYIPNYTTKNGKTTATDYPLSMVDAQGNSTPITTLKEPDTDVPTPTLHIFAYGSGKVARFIPAAPNIDFGHSLPVGSPSQIQVVDLKTGEAHIYQASPEVDPYTRYDLIKTPFSLDGTKLIVPNRNNERYYVLSLDTSQSTLIPNLEGVNIGEIIGWSAADGLIYAHILGTDGGQQPIMRFNLQGSSEKLNLQHLSRDKSGEYNVYDEILSPDGKELYYETISSTQTLPPADPTDPVFPEMNVIERYDIASGSSTVVARAAAGDYFSVGAGNFTLSSDGRALIYIESKPTSTGAYQAGNATVWRVDLSSNSQPVKIIAGLNRPFRLNWCSNSLYYYDGEVDWHGWYGMSAMGGKPVGIAGEILGCTPLCTNDVSYKKL